MILKVNNRNIRHNESEKGTALLEFSLVFPLLMLFIIVAVDVGRYIITHMEGQRVVYEGARYAAVVRDLQVGTYTSHDASIPEGHGRIITRMQNIMREHGLSREDIESALIKVSRVENQTDEFGNVIKLNLVEVEATLPFRALFRFADNIEGLYSGMANFTSVRSRAKAPYLD